MEFIVELDQFCILVDLKKILKVEPNETRNIFLLKNEQHKTLQYSHVDP